MNKKKIKNFIEEYFFFALHPCIPLKAPNAFASTRISERVFKNVENLWTMLLSRFGILKFHQSMIFPVEPAISASVLVHVTTCLTGSRSLLGDLCIL